MVKWSIIEKENEKKEKKNYSGLIIHADEVNKCRILEFLLIRIYISTFVLSK